MAVKNLIRNFGEGTAAAWRDLWYALLHPTADLIAPVLIAFAVVAYMVLVGVTIGNS